MNTEEGRRRAARLINTSLDKSLRAIAKEAGISTATVRDVRQRLAGGRDPVPPKQRKEEREGDQCGSSTMHSHVIRNITPTERQRISSSSFAKKIRLSSLVR